MAIYYWRGAVSTNVNDPQNWTLWPSGASGPPAAPTKPVWGSDIQFVKFLSSGGTLNYPIFGPSGTLTGNTTSAASTAGVRYLKSIKVAEDFPLNVGISGATTYLNVYADTVNLYHAENSHSNVYLNMQPHPTSGVLGYINPSSKAPGVNYYIKGYGNVSVITTAYPTYSNIYLYNFDGYVYSWASTSNDAFYFDPTSMIQNDMIFQGKGNQIYIQKGFAIQNDKSMFLRTYAGDSTQSLYLVPLGITGDTGPSEITQTTLKLITEGSNNSRPYVYVGHGTDFTNLQMQAGHIQFGPAGPNDGCRIGQGTMNSATCKMTISDSADVSILSPGFAGGVGFSVQSLSSGSPMPIYYSGNYSVVLGDSSYYWQGNS
jgi:hypothetical protein